VTFVVAGALVVVGSRAPEGRPLGRTTGEVVMYQRVGGLPFDCCDLRVLWGFSEPK